MTSLARGRSGETEREMTVDLKIDLRESTNGARDKQGVLATIDFSDWHFYPGETAGFNEMLESLIRTTISEAVRNSLQSYPPNIEFETDGASVIVSINLGSNWNDGWIYFNAAIEEMIDDLIERSHRNQMEGGDDAKTELAQCLLRCAAKLKTAASAR